MTALVAFGHRGSATPQERAAAEYLAAELQSLGLEPTTEPFVARTSSASRLLLHVAVAAAGACVLRLFPVAALVLALLALSSLLVEQTARGLVLSRLLPRRCSQNVWARLTPAGQDVRRRVVVCGHYDTQRTGLIWHDAIWRRLAPILRRLPAVFQSLMAPVVAAMLAQCVTALGAWVGWRWAVSATPAAMAVMLLVYAVAGALLFDCAVGAYVPGASDNASGAAAVLTVGEAWLAGPVDGVELVLLFTGCEESGLVGAAAWADLHRQESRACPTVFLNLDGLGFGPPRLLGLEVPLAGLPVNYPPDLLARCAAGQPAQDGLLTVPGYTDGLALLVRGLRGVTLVGCQPDGRLPNWHLPTDDTAHLDFESAWRGAQVACGLAGVLASDAEAPASTTALPGIVRPE